MRGCVGKGGGGIFPALTYQSNEKYCGVEENPKRKAEEPDLYLANMIIIVH